MSLGTTRPMRMLGGNNSGAPNTGEFLHVRGGTRRGGVWSGGVANTMFGNNVGTPAGNMYNLWSGTPGRLNSALYHGTGSGNIIFFDSISAPASGTSLSGSIILGFLPSPLLGSTISGWQGAIQPAAPVNLDMPFFSGLWAFAPSGVAGFTASWTPEVDPAPPAI